MIDKICLLVKTSGSCNSSLSRSRSSRSLIPLTLLLILTLQHTCNTSALGSSFTPRTLKGGLSSPLYIGGFKVKPPSAQMYLISFSNSMVSTIVSAPVSTSSTYLSLINFLLATGLVSLNISAVLLIQTAEAQPAVTSPKFRVPDKYSSGS